MPLKRPASFFLLGILLSSSGMGCAAIDALVSSPRHGQQASPPAERLTAIARVFENQGNLAKAESMYRMAIRQDPSNDFARERVDYIASLGNNRTFRARPVQEAIAVADSIEVRTRTSEVSRPNAATLAADAKQRLTTGSGPLRTTQPEPTALASAGTATIRVAPIPPVTPAVTRVSASVPHGQPATVTQPLATAPAGTAHYSIQPDSAPAATSTLSAPPESVSLDEISEWMDSPAHYSAELMTALQRGEDAGVQALAAALLADCPAENEQVNDVLKAACDSSDSLVRATARDSLIRRGSIDRAGIRDLMTLLTDNDAEIRSQAAASLRNCVGSRWTADCVSGLGELLRDLNPSVRAMAAATLGDFTEGGDSIGEARQLLLDARASEGNENVLTAIETSLQRGGSHAASPSGGLRPVW
ncbi:MAG: hypothetical protein R3C19_26270 [Planctomycetaceae bacterium]